MKEPLKQASFFKKGEQEMESAIIGLLGGLIIATMGQVAVLWYKLGRIEEGMEGIRGSVRELVSRMDRLNDRLDRANIPQ